MIHTKEKKNIQGPQSSCQHSPIFFPVDYSSTYLVGADRVRTVIHVQVIVAVQLQHVEAQHEPLQYGVRLERDDAVQIALVLRPEHGALDLAVQLLQEVVLTQRLHVICARM